jgi:hypothetical protein
MISLRTLSHPSHSPSSLALVRLLFLLGLAAYFLSGQTRPGAVTGVVTDPTGAVVPNATVTVEGGGAFAKQAVSDGQGRFSVSEVPPGQYQLRIAAEGFVTYEAGLRVGAGPLTHDARLAMQTVKAEVTVEENAQRLTTDPSANVGAVVLSGSDLNALSDDPDDLAADLQALAGPAVGPDGGTIFVDGFSDGRLPPKSSIREIRINQNPFSAEYDHLGFGRIEIFTKPGTDQLRGEARFNFGDSMFNARNPFALERPESQRRMFEGNIAGRLTKRSSFMLEAERRDMEEATVINALTLDPSLAIVPYRETVVTPNTNTELGARIDYQLSTNHTLVMRFDWENQDRRNAGLDTFSLPSRAYNSNGRDRRLQVTETAVLSPSAIHELRFQYIHNGSSSYATSSASAIQVPEAFTGGGASVGFSGADENRWQLSDMTSWIRGQHTLKFGGRFRRMTLSDRSMQNYNGVFTFSSLDSYRVTEIGLQESWTPAQMRLLGGGASQFTMTSGNPVAEVGQSDLGLFFQDDWRVHPKLTLTAGLRYETQSNIGDRRDLATRLALAWAPGAVGKPIAVVRGGFGIFYERVNESLTLQANRLDGIQQQQYLVPNPDFYPNIPPTDVLAQNLRDQAIRLKDARLRAPYIMQTALSVERQLPKNTMLSVTYANSRGVHSLRSRNINAPLPGTYFNLAGNTGIRPYPNGSLYLYESTGFFRQDQLIVNLNTRVNSKLNLFGYYTWNKASSDTDGSGSFPANQYNLAGEFARAGYDVRHRAFLGGSVTTIGDLMFSPFLTASSGPPFNITIGQDLNGDSIFNDRPAWATDLSRTSVVRTGYGVFDADPQRGQTVINRNIGSGPGQFSLNMRLSKSFAFGGEGQKAGAQTQQSSGAFAGVGGGGSHGGHGGGHGGGGMHGMGGGSASGGRYTLTFAVSARNLFNNVNLAAPVGNLSSPSFGTSTATAGRSSFNRTLDLQVRFTF